MSLSARFEELVGHTDRRSGDRRALRLTVDANLSGSPDMAVRVHDLSESGILIETPEPLATGQNFEVMLPLTGPVDTVVVWNSGRYYGCEFSRSVPSAAVSAALLKAEPKGVPLDLVAAPDDLLAQLRTINASIEHVGHQLDDTIGQLRGGRSARYAPSQGVRGEYARPSDVPEEDGSDWVVVIILILAGLAGLVLVAALLGSPLFP
jgi:hypothetical protein